MDNLHGKYTFLTDGLIMSATFDNGELVGIGGTTAKVEQIELDHVKITKGDKEEFVRLGDRVRWLPEGMELH